MINKKIENICMINHNKVKEEIKCLKIKEKEQKVYMRSDTTAPYQQAHTRHHAHGSPFLWYYAFHSFGSYRNGGFSRSGYYSSGLGSRANVGSNHAKSGVVRGGFGHTSSHVSS